MLHNQEYARLTVFWYPEFSGRDGWNRSRGNNPAHFSDSDQPCLFNIFSDWFPLLLNYPSYLITSLKGLSLRFVPKHVFQLNTYSFKEYSKAFMLYKQILSIFRIKIHHFVNHSNLSTQTFVCDNNFKVLEHDASAPVFAYTLIIWVLLISMG